MSERIRNPIDEPDEVRELERQQQRGQAPRPPDDRPDAPRETPAREPEPQERPPPREPEQPPQREAEPEPEGEPEAEAESISRLQKQLNARTREAAEARREAQAMRQQYEQWQQQLRQAQPPQPGQPDPAAIEAAKAQLRQEQLVAQFNRDCDALFRRGCEEYPEFPAERDALNAVGANTAFLEDVTTREAGHAIYHHLAQNLDEAARIMALDPRSMRRELNRIEREATGTSASNGAAATELAPARAVTRAPAPLRPIGGTSRGQREESTADFIRRRDQEEYEARYGPGRR